MYVSRLRAAGGSVIFTTPRAILESLSLAPNQDVGLSVSDGRLSGEPQPKARYKLAELVAQCEPDASRAEEDEQWL